MFDYITPEQAGISSAKILEFMKILDVYSPCTHSMIIARGNRIFHECYYAPFDADFKHRMYSVSKSFVSVAVGLLIEDGLLSFDDKFVKFFPEYLSGSESEELKELTIKDMLTMQTAQTDHVWWFKTGTKDRCEVYFRNKQQKVPGAVFDYDSPGSFMLGVIVEKLTGKPFLEFMQERFLNDIGFSKDAYCLKAPGGYSFGDSAVMCTPRDLLTFARFVMNKGTWSGKRYMNEQYLTEATTKQVDNNLWGFTNYNNCGYGYQIWMSQNGRFSFNGMGGQFAICDPKKDLIFVITADNQGNASANQMVFHSLFHHVFDVIGDTPLAENKKAFDELKEYSASRKLFVLPGNTESSFAKEIDGVTYRLRENPMQIEKFRINFEADGKAKLTYTNATGEKELHFGIGHNEFGKFPEPGYANMTATVPEEGYFYDCACSGAWAEEKKLQIKVQIIDKYFGNATFTFSFKDSRVTLAMTKTAEAFLDEYHGYAIGERI